MAKSQERHGDHQSLTPCPTFITMGNKLDEYLFFFIKSESTQTKKKKKIGRGQS